MSHRKANVIIQCRFSSARLPGKVVYPLGGIPLLAFLIRRLKYTLPADGYRLIVATSRQAEDDIVAAWAIHENVELVRGSLDDVLSRYIKVIERYPTHVNVRVTADNPFTCPAVLAQVVTLLRCDKLDYVLTKNFPYGAGVDVFSSSVLEKLDSLATEAADREHINKYIVDHPEEFRTGVVRAEAALARPDLNFTVDTPSDFQRVTGILAENASYSPWKLQLKDVISLMDPGKKYRS